MRTFKLDETLVTQYQPSTELIESLVEMTNAVYEFKDDMLLCQNKPFNDITHGIKWICIEQEQKYCEIGEKRIEENKQRLKLLNNNVQLELQ